MMREPGPELERLYHESHAQYIVACVVVLALPLLCFYGISDVGGKFVCGGTLFFIFIMMAASGCAAWADDQEER